MECDFKPVGVNWACPKCNRCVPLKAAKSKPRANCGKHVGNRIVLPPRTTEQRLQVIAINCFSCEKSSYLGNTRTLKTINCPKSCGCASSRARPMLEQLGAISFKCPLGNTLDNKLAEYQSAIDSL